MTIFKRTFLISIVCFVMAYAVGYTCLAAEGDPIDPPPAGETSTADTIPPEADASSSEETTPSEDDPTSSEDTTSSEDASTSSEDPTSSEDASTSSEDPTSSEEESSGENESSGEDTDIAGSVSGVSDPAADIRAIREYTEFALFGVLPISVAFLILFFAGRWFFRTFINSAL